MTFEEMLDQAVAMLQRRGRVAYSVLKRQFDLDNDYLEDLKDAILYAHPQVTDDGRGLAWTGESEAPPELTATTTTQPEATHEQAAAVINLATEQGFSLFLTRGMVLHGWSLAMQGQGEAGITEIRQGLAAYLAPGAMLLQPYILGLLAEAYGECGCPEEGLNALDEALTVMESTDARLYEAELYRLKGDLLQIADDGLRGAECSPEECFLKALDVARHQQTKSWELRTATSLARLWQSRGKRQEAADLLEPVYGWFTEGFDTADLKDAKTLLEQLACEAAFQPSHGPFR